MVLGRKAWQPTPVFLPRKSRGQRSLAGYSPWGSQRVRQDWSAWVQHTTYPGLKVGPKVRDWSSKDKGQGDERQRGSPREVCGSDVSTGQEHQGLAAAPRSQREAWPGPQGLQKGIKPSGTLVSDHWPPGLREWVSVLLRCSLCGNLLHLPWEMNTPTKEPEPWGSSLSLISEWFQGPRSQVVMRHLDPLVLNSAGLLAPQFPVSLGAQEPTLSLQHSGSHLFSAGKDFQGWARPCYWCESRTQPRSLPCPSIWAGGLPAQLQAPLASQETLGHLPPCRTQPRTTAGRRDLGAILDPSPGLGAKTFIPSSSPSELASASQTLAGLRARGFSKPKQMLTPSSCSLSEDPSSTCFCLSGPPGTLWSGWERTDQVAMFFSRSVVSASFVTPWTAAHQAPLSMGFSRQENWSGLPFPPPGDLPDPGI